jgi:beta-glucosidase
LFHWDYPLALYQAGGWLHTDSPFWFADYTAVVAEKLGDRVKHWMTLNEPQVFVKLGHESGLHAPGVKLPVPDLVRMTHHVLLAHGRAVQTLRAKAALPPTIGWAPAVGVSAVAAEYANDPEVVQHARDGFFGLPNPDDFAGGTPVWNDAALLGRYPESFVKAQAKHLPANWDTDLAIINQPLDFCGLNIYAAWSHHTRDAHGKPIQIADSANALQDPPAGGETGNRPKRALGSGYPRTLIGWPVTPEAMYWGARFFHERYRLPIVITENGMSGHDWVALDGKVHDPHRIDFTTRYLRELRRAAAEGVDVRGYFHWSFMDNFEWAEGYKHRFGLVHVDYQTLKRTPKDSAYWYREVIAANGANI